MNEVVMLYRPVGPAELKLIVESGYREFPPRLPEQPIFYPVLTEEYATKIARDWNVPASGAGYVTRFRVRRASFRATTSGMLAAPRCRNTGSRPRNCRPSIARSWAGSR